MLNCFFSEDIYAFIDENINWKKYGLKDSELKISKMTSTSGFFFFTRRPSLLELSITFKNKVLFDKRFESLANKYYHKFKLSSRSDYKGVENLRFVDFFNTGKSLNHRVCNTHFFTNGKSFDAVVRQFKNDPDITRFDRIIKIVNDIIRESNHIDYVVFHELALPRNIYVQIARKLSFAGINLIAGLEYKITKNMADNQLVYVLNVDAQNSIALFQSKLIGATHETEYLREKNNIFISPNFEEKLIVKHRNLIFSGLICNDLLDINNRSILRGNVDLLFVIAWNQDLETYQHLVNSASLDIHCYVSICNNKEYGDTRIRAPFKDSWRRDVHKIHGGNLDSFIISDLKIQDLRDFQTNFVSPEEPFKPTPTGFKISEERKIT